MHINMRAYSNECNEWKTQMVMQEDGDKHIKGTISFDSWTGLFFNQLCPSNRFWEKTLLLQVI